MGIGLLTFKIPRKILSKMLSIYFENNAVFIATVIGAFYWRW